MQEELIQTAINRAYSSLEPSTYKLLEKSETRLAKLPRFWYIGIFTPQAEIYEQLVDQLQPLTESLTKVMGSFRIGIWYYQITNSDHPYWSEVAPEDLIQALP